MMAEDLGPKRRNRSTLAAEARRLSIPDFLTLDFPHTSKSTLDLTKKLAHKRRCRRTPSQAKLHKFMADCSPTAGVHLIVAPVICGQEYSFPLRLYAFT